MKDLPTDSGAGFLLFQLLSNNLSTELQESFNREEMERKDAIPDDGQLIGYLERQLNLLQMMPTRPSQSTPRPNTSQPTSQGSAIQRPQQSTSTSSQSRQVYSRFPEEAIICNYCNGRHPINKCQEFKRLTSDERIFAHVALLCNRCQSAKHQTSSCPTSRTCVHCQATHHHLLHRHSAPTYTSTQAQRQSPSFSRRTRPSSPVRSEHNSPVRARSPSPINRSGSSTSGGS